MIDWQHRCLHFPDTKTGQRSAPISSQAMTLLRTIHDATGNPREGLVCRGRRGGKLARINSSWEMIREAAGCPRRAST
jgi:integrase